MLFILPMCFCVLQYRCLNAIYKKAISYSLAFTKDTRNGRGGQANLFLSPQNMHILWLILIYQIRKICQSANPRVFMNNLQIAKQQISTKNNVLLRLKTVLNVVFRSLKSENHKKKIGSANRKSAVCYIFERSTKI